MARVESVTALEHMAARHWRGTEEDRLSGCLPPKIVIPLPLEGDSPCHQLDNHLSERTWLTRPGPAFVMAADLAAVPLVGNVPASGQFRVDAEPEACGWPDTGKRNSSLRSCAGSRPSR